MTTTQAGTPEDDQQASIGTVVAFDPSVVPIAPKKLPPWGPPVLYRAELRNG